MRTLRGILTAICLSAAVALPAPADEGVWQDIYAEYHDSVVLVQVGFRLADGPVDRADLLDRLADGWGFDLRGGFLPFQAGSGFVISDAGHVVTNHHVVDSPPVSDARTFLSDVLRAAIEELGPDAGLDAAERERAYVDIRRLVERGTMATRVESAAGSGAAADRVLDDREHDLAVLRIVEPMPLEPMPLALGQPPRVADEVAAIGYPYEEILTIVFEDVVPTFSPGVITALRPNDEVVQHSASLSPGNSGGPLLDRNGLVVGVNVARILDGEALQFAVPIDALIALFGRPGLSGLRDEVEERALRRGEYYRPGPDGTVAVGPSLELVTVEGVDVELNGEPVGTTPLTLTDLSEGVYELVLLRRARTAPPVHPRRTVDAGIDLSAQTRSVQRHAGSDVRPPGCPRDGWRETRRDGSSVARGHPDGHLRGRRFARRPLRERRHGRRPTRRDDAGHRGAGDGDRGSS